MSKHPSYRLIGAAAMLAGLLLTAAPAHAESAWGKMARMLSPGGGAKPEVSAAPAAGATSGLAASTDPELGITRGYSGVRPNTEAATVQMRETISRIGENLPDLAEAYDRLGLESEETQSSLAVNLFQNPEIRKLLGEEPRFIYDPANRPDPMVAPWVRRAAIYTELSTKADALLAQGEVEQAVDAYVQILQLNDPRFTPDVRQKLAQIDAQLTAQQAELARGQVEEMVELPPWVASNTTGVLVEPGGGLALVGDYMLRVGESLPNYPEISVGSIDDKTVTYRVRDREFKVVLNDK